MIKKTTPIINTLSHILIYNWFLAFYHALLYVCVYIYIKNHTVCSQLENLQHVPKLSLRHMQLVLVTITIEGFQTNFANTIQHYYLLYLLNFLTFFCSFFQFIQISFFLKYLPFFFLSGYCSYWKHFSQQQPFIFFFFKLQHFLSVVICFRALQTSINQLLFATIDCLWSIKTAGALK